MGGREPHEQAVRWGSTCPVCGRSRAGVPAVVKNKYAELPALRLRVHGTEDRPYAWRVWTFDGTPRLESEDVRYVEEAYNLEYHLCGVGHIFPVPPENHFPDVYNMCAAIGSVTGGKSYVLTRMVNQPLLVPGAADLGLRPQPVQPVGGVFDPLETAPRTWLQNAYAKTREPGEPIEPTGYAGVHPLHPETLLGGYVSSDLPDRMPKVLDELVISEHPDRRRWGRFIRQPIVQRTLIGERMAWNGYSDLPGELFEPGEIHQRESQRVLQGYDSLLWVVDPVVTTAFAQWFTKALPQDDDREAVLRGSMRPYSLLHDGVRAKQVEREDKQKNLARELAAHGNMFVRSEGPGLRLLVAINKCDLLRLGALECSLAELGDASETWTTGATQYLERAVLRFAASDIEVDGDLRELFDEYLRADDLATTTRHQRCKQVAAALLRFYWNSEHLWDLVQRGHPAEVHVPGEGPETRAIDVRVPSLPEHLGRGLERGNARRLLMRDLVMSTIGCAAMHALGFAEEVSLLLPEPGEVGEVLFFLCSPLATPPRKREGSDVLIEQRAGQGTFPALHEASAALSQMRLASLWKART